MCVAAMTIACASPVWAGMFDIVNNFANTMGASRDVDALFAYTSSADATFKKSIDALFFVLGTEEDRVKIELELKAANEIQDPQEKESKMNEIAIEKEAAVKKAVNQADCQNRCRALDSRKKALYAHAVYNVFLSGIYNFYAVQQGKILVQKCSSNPVSCSVIALKLDRVANIVMTVPNQIANITNFAGALVKIGSAADIEIQKPSSEKEQPKEVDIG